MPGARYHDILDGGGDLLAAIDDLTVRLFDGQTSPMFQDAAKTIPVTTQGDPVARVVGQLFEYEAQGTVTYNALGAIETTLGCIQTLAPVPVIANNRTSFAIIQVKAEHTGYVYGPRSGSNGWTMRTDGRGADDDGIFEVFHWGTAGAARPIANNVIVGYNLTTPVLLVWHQTSTGGLQLYADGVLVRELPALTDDALGTTLIEAIGGLPGGSGLFNGLIFMAGQAQDLNPEQLATLQGLLLARLNELKAIQLTITTPNLWVFQRNLDPLDGNGLMRLVAEYNGPGDVEMQYNGGAWQTATRDGNTHRLNIIQPVGEGVLNVRALGGALTASRPRVGVGDKLKFKGQSNSEMAYGSTEPPITHTNAILGSYVAPDAVPAVPDPVQTYKTGALAFTDDYVANEGVPCMVYNDFQGSTTAEAFLPGAAPHPLAGVVLWDRALNSLLAYEGLDPATYDPLVHGPIIRAVVWYEGETKADQTVADFATVGAAYQATLRTLCQAHGATFNAPTFIPVMQNLATSYALADALTMVRDAQKAVRGEGVGSEESWAMRGVNNEAVTWSGTENVHPGNVGEGTTFGQNTSLAVRTEFGFIVYVGQDMITDANGAPVLNRV